MVGKETEWPQVWTRLLGAQCSHEMKDGWQALNSYNFTSQQGDHKIGNQRTLLRNVASNDCGETTDINKLD